MRKQDFKIYQWRATSYIITLWGHLKRLKNDKNIVILPADKGLVTVVVDKTDYYDKMDALVNDKQTYEVLKRDPTPALQRKLNNKQLTLKASTLLTINATTD